MEEDGIKPLVTNQRERILHSYHWLTTGAYYSQRWEKIRDGQCGNENLGNRILKWLLVFLPGESIRLYPLGAWQGGVQKVEVSGWTLGDTGVPTWATLTSHLLLLFIPIYFCPVWVDMAFKCFAFRLPKFPTPSSLRMFSFPLLPPGCTEKVTWKVVVVFITLQSIWDLGSLTRDQTHTPCIRSTGSYLLDRQGSPHMEGSEV